MFIKYLNFKYPKTSLSAVSTVFSSPIYNADPAAQVPSGVTVDKPETITRILLAVGVKEKSV